MPRNALATISPQRDYLPIEPLARQWAVTLAELFCVSLKERGSRFVELWVSALTDLAPEVLDAACKRAMQTCKFFPTPAEIQEVADKGESDALKLKAEEEWHRALRVAESDRGFENLDAHTQHAIRAAVSDSEAKKNLHRLTQQLKQLARGK